MRVTKDTRSAPDTDAMPWGFFLLLVAASLIFSRAFACATPFAALATFAGTQCRRRDAVPAVLMAWAANQAIGFGLLGYPHDATTVAWGAAIALAVVAAALAATAVRRASIGRLAGTALAFVGAYAGYEASLFAASFALSSTHAAFAPAIVARLFAINAAALGLLLALQSLAPAGTAFGRHGALTERT